MKKLEKLSQKKLKNNALVKGGLVGPKSLVIGNDPIGTGVMATFDYGNGVSVDGSSVPTMDTCTRP